LLGAELVASSSRSLFRIIFIGPTARRPHTLAEWAEPPRWTMPDRNLQRDMSILRKTIIACQNLIIRRESSRSSCATTEPGKRARPVQDSGYPHTRRPRAR
jgi:hypothetical protein